MNTLSKQPARAKQQAARLTRHLQQFAISRRGAAVGAALLLAGGGYAYIQQLQAQQKKARERYVDMIMRRHDAELSPNVPANVLQIVNAFFWRSSCTDLCCVYAGSLMEDLTKWQTRSVARQLHSKVLSSTCCLWLASASWSCLFSPSPGLPCLTAWQNFRYSSIGFSFPLASRTLLCYSLLGYSKSGHQYSCHRDVTAGPPISGCFSEACTPVHPQFVRECGAMSGSCGRGVFSQNNVGSYGAPMEKQPHQSHAHSVL